MGFLRRIEEQRQVDIQAELSRQREVEAAFLEKEQERERKERERELAISNYISDSETIILLLEALPEGDYHGYFQSVAKITGYKYQAALYSHPEPFIFPAHPKAQDIKDIKVTLAESLKARNITTYYGLNYLPTDEFFGVGRIVQVGGRDFRFDLKGAKEPHFPGLGFHFSHQVHESGPITYEKINGQRERSEGRWEKRTGKDIFVRFFPPANFVISGNRVQKQGEMSSLEKFDNALEHLFARPFTQTFKWFKEIQISETVGSEGGWS